MGLRRRQLILGGLAAAGVAPLLGLRARASGAPAPHEPQSPLRVQVALFDGFEVTDALAPFDVWKIAGKLGGALQTTLVSVSGVASVVALDDVMVKATASFDADADVLVVPGAPSLWRAGATPAGLPEAMQIFREPGKLLATVCTGAVFAARAGHLSGRHATTHKSALSAIEEQGAVLAPGRVVDDGDLLSSAGVTSGIDLALYVVERFCGAALALQVEQVIEYDRRGTVWRT